MGVGEILLFFKPFLAHFSITFLIAIQVLVWYQNLSYFFAEYHRLEAPLNKFLNRARVRAVYSNCIKNCIVRLFFFNSTRFNT